MSNIENLLESSEDNNSTLNTSLIAEEEVEKKKFTQHSAIVTLLMMTIGPLALFATAAFGTVDLMIISKGLRNIEPTAAAVIGFASSPTLVITSFGSIFSQALTAYLTKLLGRGQREAAASLANDVIRLSIILPIPFAIGYNFAIKPFLRFSNCPESLLDASYKYIMPLIYFLPAINLYSTLTGFLQSIGRSGLNGGAKLISTGSSTLIILPIIIFAIKAGTAYVKYSTAIADLIVCIILFILIYKGKFSIKLNFRMLLDKPVKETLRAFVLALPTTFQILYLILPSALVLKAMTSVDKEHSELVGSAFSSINKILLLLTSLIGSFTGGFLSAATHAFGSKNYKRMYALLGWTILISFVIIGVVSLVVIFKPSAINKMFLNTKEELDYANNLLPIPFYTEALMAISLPLVVFLVVIGKPIFSIFGAIIQTLFICVCAIIIAKKTHSAKAVLWAYNISNLSMFLLFICSFIYQFFQIKKLQQRELDLESMSGAV
ncbi:MatE family protein [Histomonas meleagridis]|uniref:MatE family protein n=1 Tax=Histomonas meleagridis TaxID=135588 RepID=UPI00355A903E|nr:MatE family protein [Histomonas meleagridis]KAH0807134.1 MatE family protein [Histomonas meleagridis]